MQFNGITLDTLNYLRNSVFDSWTLEIFTIDSRKTRSSHRWCSIWKTVLISEYSEISKFQKFRNIHWKRSVLESLFNKVTGLQTCNFIRKTLQHRCFPVNITKFLRAPILQNVWTAASVKRFTLTLWCDLPLKFLINVGLSTM